MELLKCKRCSKHFSCGTAISPTCWCRELPPLLSAKKGDTCLCKACLLEEANRKIEILVGEWKAGKKDEGMFQDHQTSRSVEGIDFNMEKGNVVFTQWYHLKRGYCCESGCRHCPYGFLK